MAYLVFARKFRPQSFKELVGQQPIVTTLENAIKQERIPQNFLFSGPRGVGKTSAARILAKALNCKKGPTENPCGKCPSCEEITCGNSMDVLEIDGASNRGIDEIRNLRETVKFKPSSGRVKVYIIDEVHMLTTEAFNALLKTLEEPPEHVKFIFATTESHKVPLTILSRCHRFNFKRIPVKEIAGKLEAITKKEKLKSDKKALFLIAKASEGALRDAEGMLDQLASFSDGKITEEDVQLMLGLASEDIYFSVLEALKSKDATKIFSLVQDLYEGGRDLVQFAKGLLEIFRHLLLLQCAPETKEFIEMSDEGFAELEKRKADFTRGELLLALSLLGNLQNQLRRNIAPPRLMIETVLLKLLHLEGLRDIDDVGSSPQGTPSTGSGGPTRYRPAPRTPAPDVRPKAPTGGGGSTKRPRASNEITEAPQVEQSTGAAVATLNEVEGVWPRVIEYVKAKRMSTGIFLSESEPVETTDHAVTLGLPEEFQFHRDMLEKANNRQLIEEAFEVVGGQKLRVQFVITKAENVQKTAPSPDEAVSSADAPAPEDDKTKLSEILTDAMGIFDGARIVKKD